jgi:DNA-binding response OmpR family regulator
VNYVREWVYLMARLLLVEDNEELSRTIRGWLEKDNHVVDIALNGQLGEDLALQYEYDLIILDWKLPIKSGLDLCKIIRAKGKNTPILMLTGKGDISDKVAGFESGADDYLTKPFLTEELQARVRALVRRGQPSASSKVLTAGALHLDLARRIVSLHGQETVLPRQEFALLEYFMRHSNEVISTERLLNGGWQTDSEAATDALYTCIGRLRKRLKSIGSEALTTVHAQGYLLKPE